ncbi:platinum sensitivity protein 3 [Monosporozyma unispora]|nr:hypothetical protein C6P44_004218 [Kazachstania unispora]
MDILAHCKVYPISNYINIPLEIEPVSQCGIVHIILDEIKNKSYQWIHLREEDDQDIIVIDLMNVWMRDDNIIKDPYLINLQNLIKFLNDELYSGNFFAHGNYERLQGIIIDNLSIYKYGKDINKLFNILLKLLLKIRYKYGCWIKTTSFKDTLGKYPTRIPLNYLNGMDKIIQYKSHEFHQIK